MAIELRHLRYFIAVADEGQLTRAAAVLELTQPALSRALRSLEHDLGVTLFRRHPRGVALTGAGRRFYPNARRALAATLDALDATRAAARPVRQSRLGFQLPWTAAAGRLVEAVRRVHPDLSMVPVEVGAASVAPALWAGRLDAALVWLPHEEPELDFQPIAVEPIVACLPAGHVLAKRRTLRFDDVEAETLPRLTPGCRLGTAYLDELRTRPARLTAEAPRTLEGVAAYVACGQAICLGAQSLAEALLRPGLVARPLVDIEPATLALAWLRDSRALRIRDLRDAARSLTGRS